MIYVTVRDGTRTGAMVGPFTTRQEAENYVQPAIDVARQINPWAHFFDYGTSLIHGYTRPGKLNDRVGYVVPVAV